MHRLIFKNNKAGTLAAMMEHSNQNKRRLPISNVEIKDFGLWLIKEEGIYLMAPTDKRFETVVYARGYKPTKSNRDTLWDKTHAVSGDDFAKFVRLDRDQMIRVARGGDITIEIDADQMRVTA